jgi:hypothetical protein
LFAAFAARAESVDSARFQASVDRAIEELRTGDPDLAGDVLVAVEKARTGASPAVAAIRVRQALDPFAMLVVEINPESRVKVSAANGDLRLAVGVWNYRLITVVNLARVTAVPRVLSPQCRSGGEGRDRWLDVEFNSVKGNVRPLEGLAIEHRVVRLRPHAEGKRAAILAIDVGQGTADLGFRNDVLLTFRCATHGERAEHSNISEASNR